MNDNNVVEVYRRRFMDGNRGTWINNVCQTRVAKATVTINGEVKSDINVVFRSPVQVDDEEFDTNMNIVILC